MTNRIYRTLATVGLVAASVAACGGGPGDGCAELARSKYSGDNRFVETTFTSGHLVKGIVGAYVSGDERTVGHWECSTESGEPEITFYSPAG